uniref:Uncharacterized LOC112146948 n=1 Tax=Oryzias melastigma TaxID=30732 RepID=A0A3B3DHZ5_ORYME
MVSFIDIFHEENNNAYSSLAFCEQNVSHLNVLFTENLICASVNQSHLQKTLESDTLSAVLCNFTIAEYACSSAKNISPSNLATILKCSLEKQETYLVEVWKLFFQNSPNLDQALDILAGMNLNSSSGPGLSNALEALGEVRIATFSQAQLQDKEVIDNWFQKKIQLFLSSPTTNFLTCLSAANFSCPTYQIVIKALSSQKTFMDSETQQAVFTHFIQPFLSRNDSSDPGCISFVNGSLNWLVANFGNFSDLATLKDLLALNPNFSSVEFLSQLAPSQMAQLIVSTSTSNDTVLVDRVFNQLEQGNALKNVDQFLAQLSVNGQVPEFQPVVRDLIMNRTFKIVGPQLENFNTEDFYIWFHIKLVYVLASFTPEMLQLTVQTTNCTNYHVVVSGMAMVYSSIPEDTLQGLANVLLGYLKNLAGEINSPACRQGIQSGAQFIETYLGPFSVFATLADLQPFNISQVTIVDFLSPAQKAVFLLQSENLSNETLVTLVFTKLSNSSLIGLESFFQIFVNSSTEQALKTLTPGVRDSILNLTLTALGPQLSVLNVEGFKLWFQVYLTPFLPGVNNSTFEIIPKNIACNSYQQIIKGFGSVLPQLSVDQSQEVLKFELDYLRGQALSGLSCVQSGMDDRLWLEDNFGQFLSEASFHDFLSLKNNFRGVDVADLLTVGQLSQLAAIPSQLTNQEDVGKVMAGINPAEFGVFFDAVSPAIEAQSANYSTEVKSAFIQAVFARGNLSSSAITDEDFLHWLTVRLKPLFINLSSSLVTPLFQIGIKRSCNSSQEMVNLLDTLRLTFSNNTEEEIYNNIVFSLEGPTSLKCYKSGSFYTYLKSSFLGFGFPNVSTFVSLVSTTPKSELLNTISPADLRQFLSQPNVIDVQSSLCDVFNNYNNTTTFLETEDVPDDVKIQILPCVWPTALGMNQKLEVDLWFDMGLKNYLKFLTKNLISFTEVKNASCFAFQKLVYYMGNNFTYNTSNFGESDVYATIKSYLTAGSEPRCYNATDPYLNSTAWFANSIGNFVKFLTLGDLTSFVSATQIQVFLTDSINLELFSSSTVLPTVSSYYITQIFQFNPTFNPIKLPGSLLCSSNVPVLAYSSISEADALSVLDRRQKLCNGTDDPEISAALASNIKTVTQQTLVNLGSSSSGLTTSQITSVSSSVLISTLSTLGTVTTWSQSQVATIIQSITTSGFQINSAASLLSLGTLVTGVPSKTIGKITATDLLQASADTNFISNMLTAPSVIQQKVVQKIISLNTSPATIVVNVPDALATAIPPAMLVFPQGTADINVLNKKTWTPDQSSMFFANLAETTFDIEQLSPYVLQGFTCTVVQKMKRPRIQQLIRACRPRNNRAKVALKESQLTCMYNLMSGSLSQNFTEYPADMLVYFSSQNIQKTNCRSYLSALGAADISVASGVLNKASQLFSEATTCLGINSKTLSKDNVEVLGNMVCTLDGSYIENSDPSILEKLKSCKDFSNSQVAAMETLLLSGNTQYGNTSTWSSQTLVDLGILPLHLTRNFWGHFPSKTKRQFLKSFMPSLRKAKTKRSALKSFFNQVNTQVVKRAAGCTVGNITQVTVSDESFPFGYDLTQFDLCLDVPVLKDNLASICQKVDDDSFQTVILNKLNQAYPSGIPDQDVQILGPVSRAASLDDISKWNISTIDTLGALMKPEDGVWTTAQSKAIITKYLSIPGNSLGTTELNTIDSYMCSLDVNTLKTITTESIRDAQLLNVSSCSAEQKTVLYEITNSSFSTYRNSFSSYYTLIKPYLGGAPLTDIKGLSTQNISMDIDTFRSLQLDVVKALTVDDVQALIGNNLPDLKLFENDTIVQTWINLQLQSDLNKLGLGLVSNRVDVITPSPTLNGNGTFTIETTTPSATLNSTTQAASIFNGVELKKPSPFLFLAALLTALLQMLRQPV